MKQTDWSDLRAGTPGAEAFVHLNHASTSLPSAAVFNAERDFLELEARLGTHRAVERMHSALAAVADAVATLVSAQTHQVALLDSASRGFAVALSAVVPDRPIEVFVSRHEWAADLMCVSAMARASLRVVERECEQTWARAIATALERRDAQRVAIVSLPIVANHSGFVNDLTGVSTVVREAGGWLFIDASQSVGQMPSDFAALGADALFFPARKWLRGPRGVAALVLSDRALDAFGTPAAPDIFGTKWSRSNESSGVLSHCGGATRFQRYEHHPALRLGFSAAINALLQVGVLVVQARIRERATKLRGALAEVPNVRLLDGTENGLVCFRPRVRARLSSEAAVHALWENNVNAAAIGTRDAPLFLCSDSLIRLSPHVITTDREIERATQVLAGLLHSG